MTTSATRAYPFNTVHSLSHAQLRVSSGRLADRVRFCVEARPDVLEDEEVAAVSSNREQHETDPDDDLTSASLLVGRASSRSRHWPPGPARPVVTGIPATSREDVADQRHSGVVTAGQPQVSAM
jgi:hypothetical protein